MVKWLRPATNEYPPPPSMTTHEIFYFIAIDQNTQCLVSPRRTQAPLTHPFRCRYLENAVKMMGRDKEGVDGAMSGFMAMLEDDKDNVPALLGMSLAFTLENSPNKVRRTGREK